MGSASINMYEEQSGSCLLHNVVSSALCAFISPQKHHCMDSQNRPLEAFAGLWSLGVGCQPIETCVYLSLTIRLRPSAVSTRYRAESYQTPSWHSCDLRVAIRPVSMVNHRLTLDLEQMLPPLSHVVPRSRILGEPTKRFGNPHSGHPYC